MRGRDEKETFERIEKNAPIQNGNDLSMKITNIHLLGTEEEKLEMRTEGKGREEKKRKEEREGEGEEKKRRKRRRRRRKKRRKRKGESVFFLVRTNE